jgi:hypothetical protein
MSKQDLTHIPDDNFGISVLEYVDNTIWSIIWVRLRFQVTDSIENHVIEEIKKGLTK